MKKLTPKELLPCSVAVTLQIIGTRWKVLIVRELLNGTKRFSELKRVVVCSQKVLTSNLRELENDGIISRKIYPVIPPKVEYSLTKIGTTLKPVIEELSKWGDYYKELEKRNDAK